MTMTEVTQRTGEPPGSSLAVSTAGLTKRFGDRTVVDGVNLAIPRGSVCGFVGPNGGGHLRPPGRDSVTAPLPPQAVCTSTTSMSIRPSERPIWARAAVRTAARTARAAASTGMSKQRLMLSLRSVPVLTSCACGER